MKSRWGLELKRAYAARGWKVRFQPGLRRARSVLSEDLESPPTALVELLQRCNGITELGKDECGDLAEYEVLSPALVIVSHTSYSREVMSPTLHGLILIGRRGQLGQSVYFVMEERPDAQRVGIYWTTYDEVEWVCDNLDDFLRGLAHGKVATDAQLSSIDSSSTRAEAGRLRMRRYTEARAKARERKLPAPLRPSDWRAHLQRAFGKKTVRFARALSKPREKFAALTAKPPRVLLDLLSATNGAYERAGHTHVVFSAQSIVEETLGAREAYSLPKNLLVIGSPGLDGILFVMRDGAESNAVGAYEPIDAEVRWLCKRLSDFVNRWGEGSLLL